jgi:hypothetical protein
MFLKQKDWAWIKGSWLEHVEQVRPDNVSDNCHSILQAVNVNKMATEIIS